MSLVASPSEISGVSKSRRATAPQMTHKTRPTPTTTLSKDAGKQVPAPIWPILLDPWLLPDAVAALVAAATPPALALLAAGAAALAIKPYRTWIAAQLYLMAAAFKNLWNREIDRENRKNGCFHQRQKTMSLHNVSDRRQ